MTNLSQNKKIGRVIWITGLSGAGKSTLASSLVKRLRETDAAVVLLDGDELRDVFGVTSLNSENYSRDKRIALALQYSRLCKLLAKQSFTVVIATISLFKEVHAWNRANLVEYFEVYLKVPLAELRQRDPKVIYSAFDAGKLKNIAGLDLPVDEPCSSDLVCEFLLGQPIEELVSKLFNKLSKPISL